MKNVKHWQKIAIVIVVIMALLNPSIKNFKEDKGVLPPLHQGAFYVNDNTPTRKVNLIIASVIEYDGVYYLGIVKNFIPIYTKR